MSSYRKLHVDEITYKYVIGKLFVKIVGPQGNETVDKQLVSVQTRHHGLITTPGMIAAYLQNRKVIPEDYFDSCGHQGCEVRADPFMSEIHNKIVYSIMCEDCYNRISEEI